MNHIVDRCPLTEFNGGLQSACDAEDDVPNWMEIAATAGRSFAVEFELNQFHDVGAS